MATATNLIATPPIVAADPQINDGGSIPQAMRKILMTLSPNPNARNPKPCTKTLQQKVNSMSGAICGCPSMMT
jgi:hypothetical protein